MHRIFGVLLLTLGLFRKELSIFQMHVRLKFKRILLFCSNRPEFVAVYEAKYAVEVTLSVKG